MLRATPDDRPLTRPDSGEALPRADWVVRRPTSAGFRRPTLQGPRETEQTAEPAATYTDKLPGQLTMTRREVRRRFMHGLAVDDCAGQLQELPAPGCSLHGVMPGTWHGWDIVPAILQLAAPVTISHLHVATLGFNKPNGVELCELLDAGTVGGVTFLASVYFRDSTRDVFGWLAEQLEARGQRIVAMRNHAKVLLAEMTNGRDWYVVESSANLRSCRNVEQFSLSNDRELHAFHAGWISGQLAPTPYGEADEP